MARLPKVFYKAGERVPISIGLPDLICIALAVVSGIAGFKLLTYLALYVWGLVHESGIL